MFFKKEYYNNGLKGKHMNQIIDTCIANFKLINATEFTIQIPIELVTDKVKSLLNKYPMKTI